MSEECTFVPPLHLDSQKNTSKTAAIPIPQIPIHQQQQTKSIESYINRFKKPPSVVLTGSHFRPQPRPTPPPPAAVSFGTDYLIPDDEPSHISELISGTNSNIQNDPYSNFFDDIKGWEENTADQLLQDLLSITNNASYKYLSHDSQAPKCTEDRPSSPNQRKRSSRKKTARPKTCPTDSRSYMDFADEFSMLGPDSRPPECQGASTVQSKEEPLQLDEPFETKAVQNTPKPSIKPQLPNRPSTSTCRKVPPPNEKPPIKSYTSLNVVRSVFENQSIDSPFSSASDRVAIMRKKLISSSAIAKSMWKASNAPSATNSFNSADAALEISNVAVCGERYGLQLSPGKKWNRLAAEDTNRPESSFVRRPHTAMPSFAEHRDVNKLPSLYSPPLLFTREGPTANIDGMLNPVIKVVGIQSPPSSQNSHYRLFTGNNLEYTVQSDYALPAGSDLNMISDPERCTVKQISKQTEVPSWFVDTQYRPATSDRNANALKMQGKSVKRIPKKLGNNGLQSLSFAPEVMALQRNMKILRIDANKDRSGGSKTRPSTVPANIKPQDDFANDEFKDDFYFDTEQDASFDLRISKPPKLSKGRSL